MRLKCIKERIFPKGIKERFFTRYSRISAWTETLAKVMSPEGKPEALDDVLVLDASYANFAGIVAASFFAEFGAEVIKIEPPEGDPAREMTPYGANVKVTGIPFLMEGRNKRYLTLDLKSKKDRNYFKKLVAKTDILIETFAAGEMDSWGIGYGQLSKLNPGLIYIAITPYGQYTSKAKELSNIPDSDLTAQAASGLPALVGDPHDSPEPFNWPLRAGMWIAWYITGISATLGGLLALIHKRATGEGQMIDVASADAYSSCVGYPPTIGFVWEKSRPRLGVIDFLLYPYGFWKCKDGHVIIAAARDQDFRGILKILGLWRLEDDWRYTADRIPDDLKQAMVLHREIENQTMERTSEELMKKALAYSAKAARSKWRGGGIPIVMKVETPMSAMKNPHWHQRRTFVEIDDPTIGKFVIPTHFVKMSETPPRVKWVSFEIGKDNEYIHKKYLGKKS